jgi:hypothetical protein
MKRKILKCTVVGIALVLISLVVYSNVKPVQTYKAINKLETIEKDGSTSMLLEKQAIVAQISPTQGIKVIIDEDTKWSATMQVLVILLGTYGGIKLINKYTR